MPSAAKSRSLKKKPIAIAASPRERIKPLDIPLVAGLVLFALLMMTRNGFRSGAELMPWPDGLEYAACAANFDHGLGPVLHFAGYSYPSRYTQGYPLILAAADPLVGGRVESYAVVTVALGLTAMVLLYLLSLRLFGRLPALTAALILACSPIFLGYSMLVMSDVPALTVTLMAALALEGASVNEDDPRRLSGAIYWIMFAALCGLALIIRPTNGAMLLAVAVALITVPMAPGGAQRMPLKRIVIIAALALAIPPLWQLRLNWVQLGSPLASGYSWWVPEVYGSMSKTFGAGFLFGVTMPRNPWGNLPVYGLALVGLDKWLNDPNAPLFYLYPFPAAVFAAIGGWAVLRARPNRVARRVTLFGLAFLGSLFVFHLFYFFTDIVFLLPGAFMLFALAGHGAVIANRKLKADAALPDKTNWQHFQVAAVVVLDLFLVIALGIEITHRLGGTPQESQMVEALAEINPGIEKNAVVVSNLSLQFLELYLSASTRSFEGMHTFEADNRFSDYHLARLYAKARAGWKGPLPAVLFDETGTRKAEQTALVEQARKGRPTYLILGQPATAEYAKILNDEVATLEKDFTMESISQSPIVEVLRLKVR